MFFENLEISMYVIVEVYDVLSLGTFCHLGRFVRGTFCPWDVLSHGMFSPWDLMSQDLQSMDCFVPWDVLSCRTCCPMECFVP